MELKLSSSLKSLIRQEYYDDLKGQRRLLREDTYEEFNSSVPKEKFTALFTALSGQLPHLLVHELYLKSPDKEVHHCIVYEPKSNIQSVKNIYRVDMHVIQENGNMRQFTKFFKLKKSTLEGKEAN